MRKIDHVPEPKGEKRPADMNVRVVMFAKIATGEIADRVPGASNNTGDDARLFEI